MAAMPFNIIKPSKAYDIMISETCRLSNGEESTGINGVICGFICPMLATNNVNPERRKPKHAISEKRCCRHKAINMIIHAINCIVSYPLLIGKRPLIYVRNIIPKVWNRKEVNKRQKVILRKLRKRNKGRLLHWQRSSNIPPIRFILYRMTEKGI